MSADVKQTGVEKKGRKFEEKLALFVSVDLDFLEQN